jgi:hypothetical protein
MSSRRTILTALLSTVMALGLAPAGIGDAAERAPGRFKPGAAGVGDPYYPRAGNGGYDVEHYTLDLWYRPGSDHLGGIATIQAVATQNLSRFNLDLDGLRVESVRVDGERARWRRDRGELVITPASGVERDSAFTTVVAYEGKPTALPDGSGFIPTRDGVVVAGQPKGSTSWYPVNDHPSDRASYTFDITAPAGRPVIANGRLVSKERDGRWTTWRWEAEDPMASYLTTVNIGRWQTSHRTEDGIEIWDAVDSRLYRRHARPRTGDGLLISQQASSTWKRLTRTIDVPDDGGSLSFWVDRDTEAGWDFFFVEAHTPGEDDWTTLPDRNGATSRFTPDCGAYFPLHPFVEHYLREDDCAPRGSTGRWHATTGASRGWERWTVDLSDWAGGEVEVSLSYASDETVQGPGVFVDDVRGPGGQGTTSFEDDAAPLDGWTVSGSPPGSPTNANDWVAGTAADVGSTGRLTEDALGQQADIIGFLGESFGPYPFDLAGGVVDPAVPGFALETQTRPVYSADFFTESFSATSVIVHELAHQWYGDSLTLRRWRHIWLNEGFATYAEWLWSEELGMDSPQEIFDALYRDIPRQDSFWKTTIGDPGTGTDNLFDFAVYYRGAMTLQALRNAVGDEDFFTILETWADRRRGKLVTTPQFVRLAEGISGEQLDELFETWLFTPRKPARSDLARESDADDPGPLPALLRLPWHGRGAVPPGLAAR